MAESTGKEGKGIVPVAGKAARRPRSGSPIPYELGAEFFRWEFATAVAGSILGINPFDQPDVQAAKDKTSAVLSGRGPVTVTGTRPEESMEELLAEAGPGATSRSRRSSTPSARASSNRSFGRRARPAAAVTVGLGPRYLHSTGQLHKGGPDTGLFVQVVDDLGEELPIPGRSSASAP